MTAEREALLAMISQMNRDRIAMRAQSILCGLALRLPVSGAALAQSIADRAAGLSTEVLRCSRNNIYGSPTTSMFHIDANLLVFDYPEPFPQQTTFSVPIGNAVSVQFGGRGSGRPSTLRVQFVCRASRTCIGTARGMTGTQHGVTSRAVLEFLIFPRGACSAKHLAACG